MKNKTKYYVYGIDNTAYFRVERVESTEYEDEAKEIKDYLLSIYPLVIIDTEYEDGTKASKEYT